MNTMNEDDKNNPGPQPWIDPALEARVVAYVMGEASAFEAGELDRLLAENPELAIFKRRIEAVHGLMVEASRPQRPKVQLSPERRQKLLETIGVKVQAPQEKVRVLSRPNPAWWSSQVLIRLAACLVMGGIVVAFISSVTRFHSANQPAYFTAQFEQGSVQASADSSYSGFGSVQPNGGADGKLENLTVSAAPAVAPKPQVMTAVAPAILMDQARALPVTASATPAPARMAEFQVFHKSGDAITPVAQNPLYPDYAKNQPKSVSALRASDAKTNESPQAADKLAEIATPERPESGDREELKSVADADGKPAPGWDSLSMYRGVNVLKYGQDEYNVRNNDVANKDVVDSIKAADASVAVGATQNAAKFDGFVNYGSPINSVVAPGSFVVSSNAVNQPVFSTRTDASGNIVTDGNAEPYAEGLFGEKVQEAQDKVPILGDIPITGRLFRSAADQSVKRNPNVVGAKTEESVGLLQDAQTFFDSGRYDLAFKRYEQALNIDPADLSARQGLEQIAAARAQYQDKSYNESRSRMLMQVDKRWELPVRRFDIGAGTITEQPQAAGASQLINRKLDEIVIPRVDLHDATVREALEFLKQRAVQLDATEQDAARKGINMVMKVSPDAPEANARITLALNDIPLRAAIEYVAKAANLKLKIEPYAVSIVPMIEVTDALISKQYKVPPEFVTALRNSGTGAGGGNVLPAAGGGPTAAASSVSGIGSRSSAKDFLVAKGVDFPPGASANFLAASGKLIVKNTQANLDLVDTLVEKDDASVPANKPSGPYSQPSEVETSKQPVSTFSLHVSDVSFQLAKDALAKGTVPDPERIRPEEFYNAFDYNDPAPAPGEEVACRIEQCAHPLMQQRDLVRIALKVAAAGRAAGQPLRLTILLDTSGSMEREDRAASVRQALQTLATLLGPNDRVTLIGFARTPRLLADQVPGDQAQKLVDIAARTPSEGGTNLEAALGLASELALKQRLPAAQNRIVLLTDGAANLGDADPARLAHQIEKTRQQGISFDACGVGANGLNDEILEALTRKGDGRYYFINKPEDADASFARQLAGAFRPAAENVKVQVVFNPSRVSQYRLIGFEKHLLKKEDFRNDKVQAAELSAEEAGVALYQVETLPEGDGELGQVFVRFRDPASGQMVERSWTMPYDAKAPSFDQASPSMQLATTAALLAEKLQRRGPVDLTTLTPVLTNLRSQYPHQARVAELIQMFEQLRQ
ncbi:hypothetical protein BH09VER1_BH09VER1_32060 [soil metagenome]